MCDDTFGYQQCVGDSLESRTFGSERKKFYLKRSIASIDRNIKLKRCIVGRLG